MFDALDQGISTVVAKQAAGAAGGGTCARVVVQLSQRLVLTRQAFEASLTLDNAGGSSELTNVTVQLIAWRKGNGTAAGNAFAVGQPATEVRQAGALGDSWFARSASCVQLCAVARLQRTGMAALS